MFGNKQQRIQPWNRFATLNQAHRRPMKTANVSESLLRNSLSFAQATHAVAERQENLLHGLSWLAHQLTCRYFFFSSRFLIWYFKSRSTEPAALSWANDHSKRSSPTLPSFLLSRAANSSISRRRSCRTRRLSCAFHSPIPGAPR